MKLLKNIITFFWPLFLPVSMSIFLFILGNSSQYLGTPRYYFHLYNPIIKICSMPALLLTIYQIYFLKKENHLLFKTNLPLLISVFIVSFYYLLESNILLFLKTPIIYYLFVAALYLLPFFFLIQIAIWLFLLFRRFWLH